MTDSESRIYHYLSLEKGLRVMAVAVIWVGWYIVTQNALDMLKSGPSIEGVAGAMLFVAALPLLWIAYRVAIPRDD